MNKTVTRLLLLAGFACIPVFWIMGVITHGWMASWLHSWRGGA